MTIRIFNAPRGSESYYYVESNVKEVTKFNVIYHNGSQSPKKICAKVEIISIMDVPEDYEEAQQFFMGIGCSRYDKIRECEVVDIGGYKKMSLEKFNELDLPNFL